MGAVAAAERQGRAVFEADRVGDLAFEGEDLGVLVRGRAGGGADGVFPCVEAEAFGEVKGVRAGDGRAETLDRGEDLLVKVPFYVWF